MGQLFRVTAGGLGAFWSIKRRQQSVFFLLAGTFVVELCAGALALAVVGIGFSIATADRLEDARADFRNHFALALRVGHFALPRSILAKQSLVAGNSDNPSAGFALAGLLARRKRAGRSECQAQHNDKRRHGARDQTSSHEILPVLLDEIRRTLLIALRL
jgi:hypothetical protein